MADARPANGVGGLVLTAVMFAAGSAMIYTIQTGPLGNQPDREDTETADLIEEMKPESQAAAWGEWRPSPVGVIDDEATEESFFVEAPEVVELAWGWSQARAEPIPTVCIEYATDKRIAQSSDIKITEVRDSYALSKALNVSASVAVKGVGYSVSGKASFAKNTNVSSTSVTYLVNAEVLNGAEYVRPDASGAVRLTDEAASLARRDIERFQSICGEGFVSATISGARAYLLAETQTSSRSERQKVRASVKGSGWGGRVKAAVSGKSETGEDTSNLTRNITFYQQGGAAVAEAEAGSDAEAQSRLPDDAQSAIDRITKLPVAASTAGKVFELQITPYQVLQNFPRGEDLLASGDEHEEIAADWGAYQTLYADLKTVLENPGQYVTPIRRCGGADEAGSISCVVEMVPLVVDLQVNMQAIAMVEALQDMTLRAMNEIEIAAETCMITEENCDYDGSLVRSPYSVRASMPLLRDAEPSAGVYSGTVDEIDLFGPQLKAVIDAKAERTRAQRPVEAAAARVAELEAAGAADAELNPAKAELDRANSVLAAAEAKLAEVESALEARLRTLEPHPEDHLIQQLREPALGRCVFGAGTSGCISNAEIRGWAKRTGLANVVTADASELTARLEGCGMPKGAALPGDADQETAPTLWFPVAYLDCANTQ